MYVVYLDGKEIFNSTTTDIEKKLLKATLELEDNAAGSLSLQFPVTHPVVQNNSISQYTSEISIYEDERWVWSGRCINELSKDFIGQLTCTFEGALAYLNDTIQPSAKYESITIEEFITELIIQHNQKIDTLVSGGPAKYLFIGSVTVDDGYNDRYTEYETTLKCLQDLVEDNGGHIVLTYVEMPIMGEIVKGYTLDYLADYSGVNSQYINFGENLLDFSQNYSLSEYCTVVLPLGKEDENGNKITIESVNQGSEVLINQSLVTSDGWIEKVVENSEIETPSILKTWGEEQLDKLSNKTKDLTLEVSAIDLSMLDNDVSRINLLDTVRVISPPHNLDVKMPVTKLSRDLLDPTQDKISLGELIKESLSNVVSTK